MDLEEVIQISREELFQPGVDKTLAHQKALLRQVRPEVVQPVSFLRRLLLSNLFYTPLAGLLGGLTAWLILEPYITEQVENPTTGTALLLLFPLTSFLIVLFIFLADGIASRRWLGNIARWLLGLGFTLLFSVLAFVLHFIFLVLLGLLMLAMNLQAGQTLKTSVEISPALLIMVMAYRSCAWVASGVALGLGMNLRRATAAQRWASVIGGAVGGALGGLFFDPVDRFILRGTLDAGLSRFVGLCAVGLCVGIFVALGERLGRQGWLRVRTGPLAGKSFILYRNPTTVGSSPHADIYLFKDTGIAPLHAAIRHGGGGYEIESLQDERDTLLNSRDVRKYRLTSGDQITVGATVMEFEERAKRNAVPEMTVHGETT